MTNPEECGNSRVWLIRMAEKEDNKIISVGGLTQTLETCGYCRGSGRVPTTTCDPHGWQQYGRRERTCEYCDGSGMVEDGESLSPCRRKEWPKDAR